MFVHRQTWAFALGKFLTDPWWWFYLFWVPTFLNTQFGVKRISESATDKWPEIIALLTTKLNELLASA